MSEEHPIREGQVVTGALFGEPMRVETIRANGPGTWVAGLVGLRTERFRKVSLTAEDLKKLTILDAAFDYGGDGQLLRLGIQAYSLGIAYEFDPYFGLSISRVDRQVPPVFHRPGSRGEEHTGMGYAGTSALRGRPAAYLHAGA